jgi:hypothetical protein
LAESDIEIEELLMGACDYQGESMASRERAYVKYRAKETDEESYVRVVIDGLMVRLANNMKTEIKNTYEKISYQIALLASYVRTHFIINNLILNCDLVEASTLIRKQLESLTRLNELDDKPLQKLIRKTPNVINTFKKMGKQAYPHLSEIAHFASPKAGELLHVIEPAEGLIGPSIVPVYTDAAHGCYDLQALVSLYFLFWFIGKQKEFYEQFDGAAEEKLLYTALQTAIDAGIIRVDDTKKHNK